MRKNRKTSDAVTILHKRYVKGNKARAESIKRESERENFRRLEQREGLK